jgi:hypothetical protein
MAPFPSRFLTAQGLTHGPEGRGRPVDEELVVQSVFREMGPLHVLVHGVAVQAGLHGGAELDVGAGRAGGSRAIQVPGRSARHGDIAAGAAHGTLQGGGKIQVTRLVVGGVRVGDIGRQYLLAPRSQVEGGLDESDFLVDLAQHGGSDALAGWARRCE